MRFTNVKFCLLLTAYSLSYKKMKLKKINEKLQQALTENGLSEANDLQQETFSTTKKRCRLYYHCSGRKRKNYDYCSQCNSAIGMRRRGIASCLDNCRG